MGVKIKKKKNAGGGGERGGGRAPPAPPPPLPPPLHGCNSKDVLHAWLPNVVAMYVYVQCRIFFQ